MTFDFGSLKESARTLLNVVANSGLEIKSSDGVLITPDNVETILNQYNEQNASALIDFINGIISKISAMPDTRAELLLKDGSSAVIDSIEAGYGPNYTIPMKNVVEKLYQMCTSGWNVFTLPNGNSYTPRNLSDKTKLMVRCYLLDEAKEFMEEYKGEPENFEKELENDLQNYMMDCELQHLRSDIEVWQNAVKKSALFSEGGEIERLKELASEFLAKVIELNIELIVDDKKLVDKKDIVELFKYYEDSDSEALVHIVNMVIETIYQRKTSLQKLIDGEYNKNAINISTISFDTIKDLFTNNVLQQCYQNGEFYTERALNDGDLAQKIENVVNDLDKFKPKFLEASRAMCRANRVRFDEEEFEQIFGTAKVTVKKEKILKERSWVGGFALNLRPDEFVETFIKTYRKNYSLWISKEINKKH